MVLIRFSDVEGIPRLKEMILSGEKRQTIRRFKAGSCVPEKGETAYLWWNQRTPKREKLGEDEVTFVDIRKWRDIKNDFDLAKRDGFKNMTDYRKHFSEQCDSGDDTEFIIIRWEKIVRARMACLEEKRGAYTIPRDSGCAAREKARERFK